MPQIQITCDTPDAEIRYTLNGSDPNESSTLYSNTIDINEVTTVKARAYKEGWIESNIASFAVSLPQLPTPEGYIRSKRPDFYFVLTNRSSYPDNTVIVFDTDEAPVEEISVSTTTTQILYGMSCTVFARCNGYLDSESVEISEIHNE